MKKDLKTLALARLSGFRHKTVKVPEWGNVSVVLREPSAEAWYLWQEVLNGDGEDDDTLSVVAKNLSAYSNSIVDTPTYFAFAKGAGLMGEAGPEAIMPLTRAADGSLGVRAVGSMNGSAGLVYSPVYHIAIQNDGANGQIGAEAAGSLVQLIDQRVQAVMLSMRRDGGMLSG